MTRLGWAILAIILVAAALFASMLSFGPGERRVPVPAPSMQEPVAPAERLGLVVPVAGIPRGALRDSWGDPREGGARAHHGLDILAPADTRVVAAAAGRVEKLFESERGGTTLYVRTHDRRWIHYYAHLAGYAPGMREGVAVKAGQWIANVGDTGDAAPGNYHLHFGVQRMRPEERWWQGQDVNPYPLLAGTAPER
jgi:murein DD-endopeptidase MepM/ murein hydrolase activator NlpD